MSGRILVLILLGGIVVWGFAIKGAVDTVREQAPFYGCMAEGFTWSECRAQP